MKKLYRLFTDHPTSLNESYFEHLVCAFSFATLEKLVKSGIIKKNEKIIIPITGSGLKEST